MIVLVAAMGSNRVIGDKGSIPWHLPSDLKRFKALTLGHTIIMGRKTFLSIGKSLPGRTNIVVTRDPESLVSYHGISTAASLADVLTPWIASSTAAIVIGGAEIYRQVIPFADLLYLTLIDHEYAGDAFFPEIDEARWEIATKIEGDQARDKFPYPFRYLTYRKRK